MFVRIFTTQSHFNNADLPIEDPNFSFDRFVSQVRGGSGFMTLDLFIPYHAIVAIAFIPGDPPAMPAPTPTETRQ